VDKIEDIQEASLENEVSASKVSNKPRNKFLMDNENLSLESIGTQRFTRTGSEESLEKQSVSKQHFKQSTKLKIKHLADDRVVRLLENN